MPTAHAGASEIEIFGRILQSERSSWDADAARAILALGFGRADEDRMKALLARAKAGTLEGVMICREDTALPSGA